MPKSKKTVSAYTNDAVKLLAAHIRSTRKQRGLTERDLADRIGASRDFVHRMERGDPACAIGSVFEAARVLNIQLFNMEPSRLSGAVRDLEDRLTLLPKSVRKKTRVIDDEF